MNNSALKLAELIERKHPAYLDLMTAGSDAIFEAAFDQLLDTSVRFLEQNSKNFEQLSEPAISAILAGKLSCFGLVATQETNSNGHVDITIIMVDAIPPRTKLGEAKIYDGPAYHLGGLKQLLEYSTGRETRGFVIEFVQKPDIEGKMQSIRQTMNANLPEQQIGPTRDHSIKWCFLSTHRHTCGSDLEVAHIGVNMHVS